MKKSRKILVIFAVIGLVLSLTSMSYAYLRARKAQESTNNISLLRCLGVDFTDSTNAVSLDNAYPVSDTEGMKTPVYKFKITIFAYTKPASDLIYREIKNGRTTNDLMLVEDENESLYVKDIIIGHFGCRKGGEKGAGQGKGNEYFRFHVTNIMSGRSKDEVITDNCVGTEYRNNKPLGQAYMYSQLYNFAFLWTTGEKGSIDLQLGSYDMYGVDKGKSIVVIEAFHYPEVTENW